MIFLKADPIFDPLPPDPGFQALEHHIGLLPPRRRPQRFRRRVHSGGRAVAGRLRRYLPAQQPRIGRRPANLRHHWDRAPAAPSIRPRSPPYVKGREPSQPLAPRGLPGQQERARKLARATQFECSEILVPVAIRHVGILQFPLSQFEQILFRDLPLFCALAQMRPLFSRQPLPLNLGHAFNGPGSTLGIHRPFDLAGLDRRWQDSPSIS